MRIKKTNGFTVIEVALVLAIAGLIFLMVFVALPSLQRLQRDTTRREDITNLIATIKKFQSNNRGSLPTGDAANKTIEVKVDTTASKNSWNDFYVDYLGGGDFVDPLGEPYRLLVTNCGNQVSAGSECTNSTVTDLDNATFPNNYRMVIVLQASCDGIKAIGSSNPRRVAIRYVLEGSGAICLNS